MTAASPDRGSQQVVIAGGGIAALEAVLALRAMSDGAASVSVISPDLEFTYRPLLVREPFSPEPAERRDLRALLADLGAELIEGRVEGVDPERHEIGLEGDEQVAYGQALIAVGSRLQPPFVGGRDALDRGSRRQRSSRSSRRVADGGRLELIVPPGVTWSLPIYEFALMTARRLADGDDRGIGLRIVTPEPSPLYIFGNAASDEVAELLELRGIELHPGYLGDRGGRRRASRRTRRRAGSRAARWRCR